MAAVAVLATAASAGDSFAVQTMSPTDGATVSGTISWEVAASQPPSRVEFYVDGVLVATHFTSPYTIGLNTSGYANGTHTLKAAGYRSNGVTASTQVSVTMQDFTPPVNTRHFASGTNQDQNLALSLRFNVMDITASETNASETKAVVDALPAGVVAMVWVGNLDNTNCATPGYSDAKYHALVDALGGDPKVYGWYISDEPHPLTCTNAVGDIRARADYLHTHSGFQKAFIVVRDGYGPCGSNPGCEYKALQPANTHVDLFGVDPYPCHYDSGGNPVPCNYSLITDRVNSAVANGIPLGMIVPVFQTFGQEGKTIGSVYYRTPSGSELGTILSTWSAAVPKPPLDYAYSFGTQCSSTSCPAPQALYNHPQLQPIMQAHTS
jgi:Bacterial Ig domain